jgi:hypothetical protein
MLACLGLKARLPESDIRNLQWWINEGPGGGFGETLCLPARSRFGEGRAAPVSTAG